MLGALDLNLLKAKEKLQLCTWEDNRSAFSDAYVLGKAWDQNDIGNLKAVVSPERCKR